MFFTEGKQKIFVSALKMSERKENLQSSVKHRKSYYEWPLSDRFNKLSTSVWDHL